MRYMVWQLEKAPTTGQLHIQGYVELKTPMRMSSIKNLINQDPHLERRLGTREQARAYCMKDDSRVSGPTEHGEWSGGQGARNDLVAVAAMATEGASMQAIATEYPVQVIRYHKGINYLRNLNQVPLMRDITVELHIGPPGVGKSHLAMTQNPNAFWKQNGKWWDGYQGQETVVFDDFKGSCYPHEDLLHALDGYPLRVEIKGEFLTYCATKIVLTTNDVPQGWYSMEYNFQALNRRIGLIVFHKSREDKIEYPLSDYEGDQPWIERYQAFSLEYGRSHLT